MFGFLSWLPSFLVFDGRRNESLEVTCAREPNVKAQKEPIPRVGLEESCLYVGFIHLLWDRTKLVMHTIDRSRSSPFKKKKKKKR